MKTIKFFLTIVGIAIVMIATAVEKPTMNVIRLDNEKALIAIENGNPVQFELSIESQNGDLLYYKKSKTNLTNLRQVINYSELENGEYLMKLKVNDTFLTTDFRIDNNGIKMEGTKTTYAPHFEFKSNILKFSYLNFDKENMKFKIYNNDELVYENKLGKDFVITEGYDLSKLEAGKYQVELSSLTSDYTFNIQK